MEDINNEGNLNFSTKALYDLKLVERAVKFRDQKAFAELMKRYWEPIFFAVNRMINNKDDSEDLTIEIFSKAFKNLEQYSPQFAFSTWLFKIASNHAIDHHRRKTKSGYNITSLDKPIAKEGGEEMNQQIQGSDPTPEETFIKKENSDQVHEIIEKLKPRYKEIVVMFYMEELSIEEISIRLSLPIATIKTRLFRARELLVQIVRKTKS